MRARASQVISPGCFHHWPVTIYDQKLRSSHALSVVSRQANRLCELIQALPADRIEAIGDVLIETWRGGRQVFVVGNGGSAATASHIACDLGRIEVAGSTFRVSSLADNTALLSALANDIGYEHVFVEQLRPQLAGGDALISISASGRSPNVLAAMRLARERQATTLALLGFDGGDAIHLADEHVLVCSDHFGLVEDVHLAVNHLLVAYLRERLSEA